MSEKPDDLIGKTLGQFTLLEEIGRGGMATVYSARQQSMNRMVAIKVLPRHFLHDPGFLERFEREVEVISQLEHPHILPIYDYGEAEGVPFIAMRYLGGGSMAQWVRRERINMKDLERPLMQVAQALDYAHQQGIVHRDLKPGNIMLDESNNAYLSDFGIARVVGSDLTGSAIIGTPAYMSPEQAQGAPIDSRSDIYALGIVLFELITGREPYTAETPMGLLLMHLNEPLPPMTDFRPDVPDALEDVIVKATAKNPDERFNAALELAEAFSEALRTTTPAATAPHSGRAASVNIAGDDQNGTAIMGDTSAGVSGPTQAAPPAAAATRPAPEPSPPPQTARRGPFMWVVLAIVALVLVGGGALLATGVTAPGATASIQPTPTPFASAQRIVQDDYAITIPDYLMPLRDDFIDVSDADRLLHRWQSRDNTEHITLALVNADRVTIDDYQATFYESQPGLRFIDESTAEDGTLRRSYRVDGEQTTAAGQIDVFYRQTGERLAVLELYTADSIGGDEGVIDRLQQVLDSLRVTSIE